MSSLTREYVAQVLGARLDEVLDVQVEEDDLFAVVTLHAGPQGVVLGGGGWSFDQLFVQDCRRELAEQAARRLVGEPDQPTHVPPPPPAPAGEVPTGSADDVLAWVGDDVERARQALAVEGGREKPRQGLTTKLLALVEQPPAGDGA